MLLFEKEMDFFFTHLIALLGVQRYEKYLD